MEQQPISKMTFPRSWFFDAPATTDGDRFRSQNIPSELTYRALLDSVAFISEAGDEARETRRGLIKLSSDEDAVERRYSWNYVVGDMKVVLPHQMPAIAVPDGSGGWVEPSKIYESIDDEVRGGGLVVRALSHNQLGRKHVVFGMEIDKSEFVKGYKEELPGPVSGVHTITHGLNTFNLICALYEENPATSSLKEISAGVEITSLNEVELTFEEPTSEDVHIVIMGIEF